MSCELEDPEQERELYEPASAARERSPREPPCQGPVVGVADAFLSTRGAGRPSAGSSRGDVRSTPRRHDGAGAIAQTLANGETGCYVLDDWDPARLAECLVRLLRDDALRTRMARASREQYLTLLTQQAADRRLANWLLSVAECLPDRTIHRRLATILGRHREK